MGTKIKKYLEEKGIKQGVIAKRINVSDGTFSDMLRGKRKITAEEYLAICEALGVDLYDIELKKATVEDRKAIFERDRAKAFELSEEREKIVDNIPQNMPDEVYAAIDRISTSNLSVFCLERLKASRLLFL